MSAKLRPIRAAVAGLALGLAVAAGSAAAQEIAHEPAGAVGPQSVFVKLKAGTLGFDRASIKAGRVSVRIENTGDRPYALAIRGPGLDWRTDGLLLPHEARTQAFELEPGRYTLTSPRDGAPAEGMTATLEVTE
jgi:hypothetical protein